MQTSDYHEIEIINLNLAHCSREGFDPWLSLTKDSKKVHDAALLNTQHYKVWN